ncbi:hypothetical protein X777_06870, partial [Ooceraea biroi]
YVGQTKRHLETRIKEHISDIRKQSVNMSVVSKHRLEDDHEFDWTNVHILHREDHLEKREIAEMVFIKRHNNTLNLQKDTENLPIVYNNILRKTHLSRNA